jgi:hypothetical protein
MAPKKKQDAGKPEGIHFVNARPSSETERIRAQRMVRAHVGRWISDQTKDREPSTLPSSSRTPQDTLAYASGSRKKPPTSSLTLVSRPSRSSQLRTDHPTSASGRSDHGQQWSAFPQPGWNDSSDSSDDSGSPAPQFNDPSAVMPWQKKPRVEREFIRVLDPFDTLPSRFPREIVDSCENYCMSPLGVLTAGSAINLDRFSIENPLARAPSRRNRQPQRYRRFLVPALINRSSSL